MKSLILESLERREAESLQIEGSVGRLIERIQRECLKGREQYQHIFKEGASVVVKVAQIEEFIFTRESENSTTRRTDYELESLNKLRTELSVVKDRLQ